MVELEHLRKNFGAEKAVNDVNLAVAQGEFVTLLGPSGCGKTTTLRCIAGLVNPDAGAIMIDGRNITALPTHRRNLGMVFQNYGIFPHMTVFDNVAFGLEGRGLSKEDMRGRVREALAMVELPGYEDRY
ncbi:MAG: ABC transporter ATP-binding protein, partial [Pseudolabrys sp.]